MRKAPAHMSKTTSHAPASTSYESAAHCGGHGAAGHHILHSKLYFASKDEVKEYNETLTKSGFFQPDDKLSIVGSDQPVNAKFDNGSIKLLPNADVDAKTEATGV